MTALLTPILLGTGNPKKAAEIRAILSRAGIASAPWPGPLPGVEEDGRTFADNAARKALALAKASGRSVLADDSGLEVGALGGAPGVRSHRYAGEPPDDDANNRRLLEELAGVPAERRGARFVCALALADPSGLVLEVEGTCEGRISEAPRGKNDFGYDPVFFYPPLGKTFAELAPEEKNRVSHRARALADFVRRYKALESIASWGA